MKPLSEIEIELSDADGSYLVAVVGNLAYIGVSNSFGDRPLVVVDVSSSASGLWALGVGDRFRPYLAGHFPFAGDDWGVAGDWLYVASGQAGLYTVQVEK